MSRWQAAPVGPRWVDPTGDLVPLARAQRAPSPRLAWREDRERDAGRRQHLERFDIDGSFRQPHAFGSAAEAMTEIGDAPGNLRFLVVSARQRHDQVVVNLRQRIAVAPAPQAALPIALYDPPVHLRAIASHPRQ